MQCGGKLVVELLLAGAVIPSAAENPSVSQSVFTITKKDPTRAFSWLKAPTSIGLSHLRHYAKQALTQWCEIGSSTQKSLRTGRLVSIVSYSHFQPGEGPSRGLLRDCENRF